MLYCFVELSAIGCHGMRKLAHYLDWHIHQNACTQYAYAHMHTRCAVTHR